MIRNQDFLANWVHAGGGACVNATTQFSVTMDADGWGHTYPEGEDTKRWAIYSPEGHLIRTLSGVVRTFGKMEDACREADRFAHNRYRRWWRNVLRTARLYRLAGRDGLAEYVPGGASTMDSQMVKDSARLSVPDHVWRDAAAIGRAYRDARELSRPIESREVEAFDALLKKIKLGTGA
jgi:hypothetical protein